MCDCDQFTIRLYVVDYLQMQWRLNSSTTTSSSSSSSFYDSSHIRPPNFFVLLIGLEKYLNSSLPLGQVALTYCSSGAFSHLSKFSNSLIIHEPKKWKSFTHVFECNNLYDLLVTFLVLMSFIAVSWITHKVSSKILESTELNWVVCDSLVVYCNLPNFKLTSRPQDFTRPYFWRFSFASRTTD